MSEISRRSNIDAKSVPGVATHRRVTLTSAQILALHSTPIVLVPAPGAGKYISVDEVVAQLTFGTTAYTGANDAVITYTDGSGVAATGALPHTAFLDAAATAATKVVAAAVVPVANAAVVISTGTANPAAGDSTITLDIAYRVCGF